MDVLRIAGRDVLTARVTDHLRPYARRSASTSLSVFSRPRVASTPTAERRATGLIAGRDREVECRYGPDGVEVRIAGLAIFAIAADGSSIEVREMEASTPRALVDEAVLGPPLLLALALQGVACLHAGAAAAARGVVAWLGPSGAGKSTLAAYLDRELEGWQRCADDLLPLEAGPGGVDALPHFPQPKLPPGAQWCGRRPERLPLRAVYLLGEDKISGRGVTVESVSPTEAAADLLRQTAVWSLFSPELAQRHLALCACIAETVPVRRLLFPRRFEVLPEVAAAIAADLQARS